ncbi:MAG TPA: hypothetical protein VEQ85_04115, partial [Lacipirellulaceae bacterium]|nr:hypothetical protein [Lacipirellulaceae bacterium]
LFALTLAAPAWLHRRPQMRSRGAAPRAARTIPAAAPSAPLAETTSQPAPRLPPLARPAARYNLDQLPTGAAPLSAPAIEGAIVESDDYVVVDEPLYASHPAAAAESYTIGDAVGVDSPGGPAFPLEPLSAAPAPAPPALPTISIEPLLRAREALLSLMAQARDFQMAAAPVSEGVRPRVMVRSSADRLAMAPAERASDPAAEPLSPRIALAPSPAPTLAEAPPLLRHQPIALLRDLAAFEPMSPARPWADRVAAHIDQLMHRPISDREFLTASLAELKSLAERGTSEALDVALPSEQSAWIRAARALDRRLPVWQAALAAGTAGDLAVRASSAADDAALWNSLNEVAAMTAGAAEGAAWRSYLRLDDLAGLTSVGASSYIDARRAAARDVLLRMSNPRLTPAQTAFLSQPAMAALARDLRPWASGPVSLDALAALVETYELSGSLLAGETLAELRLRMKWSGDPQLESLAEAMNSNYRNANLRIAVSAEMFNRLIPAQPTAETRVNDRIQGTAVRGRSRTETNVSIRLVPDPIAWRLALEVDGTVQSHTYSDVGPARVRNVSRMEYDLSKLITLDRTGLHVAPAEAKVDGRNSLVGVETKLDPIPLVGPLVEEVVRNKHRDHQAAAVAQVKAKVGRQARTRMDEEADAKLKALQQRVATELWGPLERFALSAEPVDMSTTSERAVLRLRMAAEQHLGAHTPRPTAPSDSLASLQLHHSALNNAARGLGLEGRRMTVGELHELLRAKFANRPEAPPADLPHRAIVEFASHDAVRVACHDDCVELTLNIVELRKGRDSIRNVGVHAFFRPVVDGLEMKLVREGTLQFEGAHLRTGPRLVLHSVFGKLLRKDQEVPVLAPRLGDDPRLAGLMVTQLVIDDGWIALSVGPARPERTAWRTRGAGAR